MSSASEELHRLNRIHDSEPQAAADGLLQLDATQLSPDDCRTYAFLVNHVLGEKFQRWNEAAARLASLTTRADAPLAVLRQYAVAARYAGSPAAARAAVARLGRTARADAELASLVVDAAQLNFAPDPAGSAEALARTATRASAWPPSALDESLAASFNNATNAVYYATRDRPLSPDLREALLRGADAALVFWLRAGGWMQHERAHYLCAKVALRVGEPVAAVAAAERGLAIVAANGDDGVERSFLLQLLAAACERAGAPARAQALRAQVSAAAARFDEPLRGLLAQDASEFDSPLGALRIAFIGGGNMAAAIINGLLRAGASRSAIHVVEPSTERCAELARTLGVSCAPAPDNGTAGAQLVVLAVKPQQMREACAQLRPHLGASAVVVSVAAGIRAADIARWLGTQSVVRCMPNTPALVGQGVTGMAALAAVGSEQRAQAEALLRTAGPVVWFDDEAQLDAVTAVSGSGPAYVFYFIEALMQAGSELGFSPSQARELAIATFTGAAQLAAQSPEPPAVLRERVTSKGGTTAAALAVMDDAKVRQAIARAVHAAQARAREMAEEFGR